MGILEVSYKVEDALKEKGLAGTRYGSGFCILDGARDVQFGYSNNTDKNEISKTIKEAIKDQSEYTIDIKFRDDSYSFYVKPINPPEGKSRDYSDCTKGVPEE